MASESRIQDEIRVALGRRGDVALWRNNVGVARDGERFVRYGLALGSSDLIGVLAPSGRFFALEVKSSVGRATKQQTAWLAAVREFGGFACVVRSANDALAAVERALSGAIE